MNNNWHSIFNDFKKIKVLIVGDAMIDSYMWGIINRQSPEAPIPIVDIDKYEKKLSEYAELLQSSILWYVSKYSLEISWFINLGNSSKL